MKAYIMGSNLKRSLKRGEGRDWSFFQLKLSNSQPEIENGVAYKKNVYNVCEKMLIYSK